MLTGYFYLKEENKVKHRKIYGLLLGLISLALVGTLVYRLFSGLSVGYQEIILTSIVTIAFFYTWTWGSRKNRDGILPDEELGKRIEQRSMAFSYYPLVGLLWIGLIVDKILTDTTNVTLLVILGVALIVPSVLSFIITQTYSVKPTFIGETAEEVVYRVSRIKKKTRTKMLFITGLLTTLFITGPAFRDSGNLFYDFLVFLFGEPSETGVNPLDLLLSAVTILLLVFISYRIYQSIVKDE